MNQIGILCKWECPSCGMILKTTSPFWTKQYRKNVAEPDGCSCGRKSSFKLVEFEPCEYHVEVKK